MSAERRGLNEQATLQEAPLARCRVPNRTDGCG